MAFQEEQGQNRMEMNEMWFKKWFLNALRDEEVKGVIQKMTADAVVSIRLQVPDSTKVVELERKLESKEKSLQKAQDSLREAQQSQHVVKAELSSAKVALSSAKGELRKLQGLSDMKDVYDTYQSLSPAARKRLGGVINGRDLLTFVCSGVQESSLERFWCICNESMIDGDDDAKAMIRVFDRFFEVSQTLGTLDPVERLRVEEGDRFDNDLCTRIAHSAPTGSVKEVLFQGYRYSVSRKIVKKSLVRV